MNEENPVSTLLRPRCFRSIPGKTLQTEVAFGVLLVPSIDSGLTGRKGGSRTARRRTVRRVISRWPDGRTPLARASHRDGKEGQSSVCQSGLS